MWKITISQQSFCWFQVSNDVYVYFIYIVSPYLDYFSKWRAFWSDVYWYYLHFVYRKPSTSHFVLVVIFSITLLLVATAKYSVNTWSCDGTNFKPQDRRQQWDSRFYSRPRPGTWKVRRPEAKGNWGGSGWIPWIRMSPSQATAGPMGHWKSVGPQFSALVQSTVSLVLGNKKIGFQGIPYFPPAHEPGGQDQVGWDIRGWPWSWGRNRWWCGYQKIHTSQLEKDGKLDCFLDLGSDPNEQFHQLGFVYSNIMVEIEEKRKLAICANIKIKTCICIKQNYILSSTYITYM